MLIQSQPLRQIIMTFFSEMSASSIRLTFSIPPSTYCPTCLCFVSRHRISLEFNGRPMTAGRTIAEKKKQFSLSLWRKRKRERERERESGGMDSLCGVFSFEASSSLLVRNGPNCPQGVLSQLVSQQYHSIWEGGKRASVSKFQLNLLYSIRIIISSAAHLECVSYMQHSKLTVCTFASKRKSKVTGGTG